MKKLSIILSIVVSLAFVGCTSVSESCKQQTLNVCQFNLRYNPPNDGKVIKRFKDTKTGKIKVVWDGSQPWEKRMPLVVDYLRYNEVDVCGTQELSNKQIAVMMKAMPEYKQFGIETGGAPHNNVIVYKPQRLDLLEKGVFWLSETPEKSSRGFGAHAPRNCNWGKFKDKITGKEFYLFNTHYHHIGDSVRDKSSELMIKKIREIAGDNTFFMMGDLNAIENSNAIQMLKKSGFMIDARSVCKTKIYGSKFTNNFAYTGRSFLEYPSVDKSRGKVPMCWIDWVFVSKNVEVLKYAVHSECYDGVWLSDHFPLLLKVNIK